MIYHTDHSYRRDVFMVALMWALAIVSLLAIYQYIVHWAEGSIVKRAVYNVCEYTRTADMDKQACGVAQDSTDTQFLCAYNNNLANNYCWVEKK